MCLHCESKTAQIQKENLIEAAVSLQQINWNTSVNELEVLLVLFLTLHAVHLLFR